MVKVGWCAGLSGLELDIYSKTLAHTLEERLREMGVLDEIGISIEQAVIITPHSIVMLVMCAVPYVVTVCIYSSM